MYDFDTLRSRDGWGSEKWAQRTSEEAAAGVVPLSIADMEFIPAPEIEWAIVEAARRGVYGYTGPDAAYLDAVKSFLQRHHGLTIEGDQIVPVPGVVPALYTAVRAFSQPGDGVIIQPPVYPPFYQAARLNERRLLLNPLIREGMDYRMDFDGLDSACAEPGARLLILCSPHNPVGRVWTREELSRVCEIANGHGVLVLADEIHSDLILSGSHTSYPLASAAARENCVLFTSPSKTFNLAGLQLANAVVFDKDLRARYRRQLEIEGYGCIPFFARAAVLAAYTQCDAWLEEMLEYVRENERVLRGFLSQHLPMLRMAPLQGTYLAWIDCRALGESPEALEAGNRAAGLVLDEGGIFGEEGRGFERINLAVPRAELLRALERLKGRAPGNAL